MRQLLLLAFGSALTAQTFIVDALNGPGTHYTTIAAAVAAVPNGSTLLVQPGTYAPFVIDAKGLTLFGGPGVNLALTGSSNWPPTVEIRATTPGQTVVLRGFRFSTWYATAWVHDCAGPVLVEDVTIGVTYYPGMASPGTTWRIERSAQVMLRSCWSWSGFFTDSNVILEGCTFDGYGTICALGTCSSTVSPGLTIVQGTTQIVGCVIYGGSGGGGYYGYPARPNRPAIAATNAMLRILSPTTLAAPQSWPFIPDVEAITGTGTLRIDPGVTVISPVQPAIAQSLATQISSMPAVRSFSATPGGTMSARALGPVGNVAILVLGFPGPPLAIPGVADEFWIDSAAYLFAAFGVPQTGAPITATVSVPSSAAFVGLQLAWQSVTVTTNGLETSNPTWCLVY